MTDDDREEFNELIKRLGELAAKDGKGIVVLTADMINLAWSGNIEGEMLKALIRKWLANLDGVKLPLTIVRGGLQ